MKISFKKEKVKSPEIKVEETKEKNEKEAKKEKEKKPDVIKSCLDLIPIRFYEETLDAFKLSDDSYMDIVQIVPRDLANLSDDEIKMEIINFIKILKMTSSDLKFISIKFPLNTDKQQAVLYRHYEKAEDEVRRKWIKRQIMELQQIDATLYALKFYLFIFDKTKDDFLKTKENILKLFGSGNIKLGEEISKFQKIQVLTKINNLNTVTNLNRFDREERYMEDA